MHQKLKKILSGKPFVISIGLLIAYFLFAYFAVNPIAKRVLPWIAETKLASHMTVDQVKFDPLRLILSIDNLRLAQPDGAELAGFKRLSLDLESNGIFQFAWHLKEIRLIAPRIALDIAPDGKFNWTDLIAKLNEDKTQEDSGLTRLLIDHILIDKGNISYTERNRPQPFKTVLQPLGLELDGLSTLPESRGDYLLSAKLPEQGGTLKWKGDLALNPIASKGSVELQHINAAKLMQAINQQSLPFKLNTGELNTSFSYEFAMLKGETAPVPQARLNNVAIQLTHMSGDLDTQAKIALDEASLLLPALDFSMQKGTQLRFQGLNFAARQLTLTQNDAALFKLQQADVKGVDFDLTANQLKVAEVLLQHGEINATRAKNGMLDWQKIMPPAAPSTTAVTPDKETKPPLNFDIASLQLQHWKADYTDQTFVHALNGGIKDFNLDSSVSNAGGDISINKINVELAALALQSALYPQPIANLAKASLKNGAISLKDSTVKLAAIELFDLQTQVIRAAGEPFDWQTALKQLPVANPPAPTQKPDKPSNWKVTLDIASLENGNIHFEDKSTPTAVSVDVQHMMLELRDSSLDLAKPLPVKASFQLKQGGQFEANGKITLAPLSSDLQIKLKALSLKPFSPYINQVAILKLKDGEANVHGKLALRSEKAPTARFTGGFSINKLALIEQPSDALFLGWKSVSSNSLKLAIAPDQLHMNQLRIVQPVGKFIIHEDKTLNVKRILRAPTAPSAKQENTQQPETTTAESKESFPVSIDRVSIDDGNLEFADLSLRPQFGTHINTLSGVINGLSSKPDTTAQVELDGKVDEYGSARIRGSVQPFNATDFTDLKLIFRNVEMSRLTPYSGKFAGREIESGKLSVDLEYKIKQRQLTGENNFVINRLKLGERVESPDAVNLPLDLAIALLQDGNGLIDLDLPISGSLDDPQFSYGKIVWKAIVNVLGKIVTSPFRALGNLLGISSDKLEAVAFDPGSATLAPQERESLKAVAGAVSKRPTLTLTVAPAFDAVVDKAALQELSVRREVAKELGLKLKPNEAPGPVDLNNPKTQTAVENLLKDRKGEKRSLVVLDSIKNYFKKTKAEDLPKYTAMLQQLESTTEIPEADLVTLANARAAAVETYMEKTAGLEPERISISAPVKVNSDGKTVKLKLELGTNGNGKNKT